MHISYWTHPGGFVTSTGFGYAGFNIVSGFQSLGHQVSVGMDGADVKLMFTQPPEFIGEPNVPTIGYTPWESTEIPEEWYEGMHRCDYFWATSELNKKWYQDLGIEVDFVFPHGVSRSWTGRKRRGSQKGLKFLHVGEPAPRKCGQMAFDAFVELFKDSGHTLTIKSYGQSTVRAFTDVGIDSPTIYNNVRLITDDYTTDQMISLFQSHDVLIYPSWGEGFGFIPLQALATGMPVIFNPTWAPYSHYSVGLDVDDSLADSPWQIMHPGKMLKPSYDSLKEQMLKVSENFEYYSGRAFGQLDELKHEFSWSNQCSKAVDRFEKIIEMNRAQ